MSCARHFGSIGLIAASFFGDLGHFLTVPAVAEQVSGLELFSKQVRHFLEQEFHVEFGSGIVRGSQNGCYMLAKVLGTRPQRL